MSSSEQQHVGYWLSSNTIPGYAIPDYQFYPAIIQVGSQDPSGGAANRSAFTPEDAYVVDQKIDDGRPGTGLLRVQPGVNGFCTDKINIDVNYQDANFVFTDLTASCSLGYIQKQ